MAEQRVTIMASSFLLEASKVSSTGSAMPLACTICWYLHKVCTLLKCDELRSVLESICRACAEECDQVLPRGQPLSRRAECCGCSWLSLWNILLGLFWRMCTRGYRFLTKSLGFIYGGSTTGAVAGTALG